MRRLLLIALAVALPQAALADPMCSDRQSIVGYLADQHGELPVAAGLANNGGAVEVLASDQGATWTILITMPDGRTCMMAAGHGWQTTPLVAAVGEAEPGA